MNPQISPFCLETLFCQWNIQGMFAMGNWNADTQIYSNLPCHRNTAAEEKNVNFKFGCKFCLIFWVIICGGPVLAKKNIFFPRLESGLLQDEKLIFCPIFQEQKYCLQGEGQSGQYRCKVPPISMHHFFCSNRTNSWAQIPTRKSSESGIGGIAFKMILNISYDAGKLERG